MFCFVFHSIDNSPCKYYAVLKEVKKFLLSADYERGIDSFLVFM